VTGKKFHEFFTGDLARDGFAAECFPRGEFACPIYFLQFIQIAAKENLLKKETSITK
jgi:hypothetical protein